MKIGILNSGGYNFNSIKFALNRIGIYDIKIVTNISIFHDCDKIIIPGVGHAKNAIKLIEEQDLRNSIISTSKPVLGICLGMQLMCNFLEEGNVNGLNIFSENVALLPNHLNRPQMGYNKLINGKFAENYVYFANSYFVPLNKNTISKINYDNFEFSAIIQKDNFLGYQFHPEKSGAIGEKMLREWCLS